MSIDEYSVLVARPVEATALITDLRNFTPLLNECGRDSQGINTFCHFLGGVYSMILRCCLTALPMRLRSHASLNINSTGDGALIVFTGEWHFAHGFLAAILLDVELRRRCQLFAATNQDTELPPTGFGIGVESGLVSRIAAQPPAEWARPVIDTYVGECINVAARAEGVTKLIDSASTVFSAEVVERVAEALFGETFRGKTKAEALCRTDEERHHVHDSMRALARKLCLAYIQRHHLKGVAEPLPLYRLTDSSLSPERPRVRELLGLLTRGDVEHLTDVIEHIQAFVEATDTV